VQGGPPVALPLPEGAALVQLPPLLMREEDSSLYDPLNQRTVPEIFSERAEMLRRLAANRFSAVVIELYPFGRNKFSAEILELIREVKKHNPSVKVVCSVRDILVEKPDADKRSKKIVKILRENFDRVWVHADPNLVQLKDTFPLSDQVEDLLFHTGFVGESRPLPPVSARKPKVLLSLGGGSVGSELYLAAAKLVGKFPGHEFEFILGPYTDKSLRESLQDQLEAFASRVTFSSLRPDFEAALQESSLSISMGGYNTVMNLLRTRTPALVFPYDANQEQEMRAKILEKRGFLRVLSENDLVNPDLLEAKMRASLTADFPSHVPDLSGASRSAEDLVRLIEN
jgi:predicted glycosyltransferase